MRKLATILALLALPLSARAQVGGVEAPERTDVIWVRDVQGAALTLDGKLDEPVWQQAEKLTLKWNQNAGMPGSGQKIDGQFLAAEPSDPSNATVYVLRKGNTLWLGMDAADQSIAGSRALHAGNWNFDGIIMNIADRARAEAGNQAAANFFGNDPYPEFFYSWWNPVDTLQGGKQKPGAPARAFGRFGLDWEESMSCIAAGTCVRRDTTYWNYRAFVKGSGIANDETHGMDEGYQMEMTFDLGKMGYDFEQAGGDRAPWNIAVQDYDFPDDPNLQFTTRVWFQNQWANNINEGIAYLAGSPDVTVSSGDAPVVRTPDFTIRNLGTLDVTLDGNLGEWSNVPDLFKIQYHNWDLLRQLPLGMVGARYYRPDINGDQNAAQVVDPSTATVKAVFKGDKLYLGVMVDDAAISGAGENTDGRDGIAFAINRRDTTQTDGTPVVDQLIFAIDSTGAPLALGAARRIMDADPTALRVALMLDGTAADPEDVDTGYNMEIEIDLPKALGYPAGRGDGLVFLSSVFYDADYLQDAAASYATRTWFMRENATDNGPGAWSYLNPAALVGTAAEGTAVAGRLRDLGAQPNPARDQIRLHYALPEGGEVGVVVFDLLGRRVASLAPQAQTAGEQTVLVDGSGLAAGVYFYRVTLRAGSGATSTLDGRVVVAR